MHTQADRHTAFRPFLARPARWMQQLHLADLPVFRSFLVRSALLLRKLAIVPIRFYQYCISPLFPARCRFYPTCSAYACQAILQHGILKGGLLGVFRILRCNPWSPGGYDPVPPAKASRDQRNY